MPVGGWELPLGFMVRRGSYFDSIALMRVAEQARQVAGVTGVAAVMGTEANRAILAEAGLASADTPETAVSDLLVAVRATTDDAVQRALSRVAELLSARRDADAGRRELAPRTTLSATRVAGTASLALIAVPGGDAVVDALQALSAGLHVFLFSDGVSLEDEVTLKRRARARNLLVMGPECGTAIVNGVGLGFANRVRRGPIGVVGASGTGIQELTTLVHRQGAGISHALGTGGRDLHAVVGGITTLQALALLGADNDTRVIVLVSKPSSREVGDAVLAAAAATGKPVVACLLGYEGAMPAGVREARTLEEAAEVAVGVIGGTSTGGGQAPALRHPRTRGEIRGLYTGGTLCEEARRLVGDATHRFVDFGAEEYTRGRPHPIIDPSQRHTAIVEAAGDPSVGVLLLDLVLGDCAHPDPAGALDPVLAEAYDCARRDGRELAVVAHVVGTEDDPQDLARQENILRKRGVVVCASNRLAALSARDCARPR
jgi:succinyl-CoA synthetase alpha subunit